MSLKTTKNLFVCTAITTALAISPIVANAADVNISTDQTGQTTLGAGDSFTVTNNGSYTTTVDGPSVLIDNVAANSITVNGAITGAATGIFIENTGGLTGDIIVGSSGLIDTQDEAISVDNSTITGQIINNGTINTALANKDGVDLDTNSSLVGGFINNGMMTVGEAALSVQDGSDAAGGFINNGTIISLTDDGFDLGNTTFTGVVTNNGTIEALDSSGDGIDIGSATTTTMVITNNGLINVDDNGFEISTNSIIAGGIVNNGTITAGSTGFDLTGGTNVSGGIINTGAITAAMGINLDASQISGGFTNTGTLNGTGGTAINYVGVTGASPIAIDDGRIIGNVTDDTPTNGFSDVTIGGDFTTEGNFTVSDLTVTAANTLTISAGNAVTLDDMSTSAGTLSFGVASPASTGSLVVSNGNVDLTGTTIEANFSAGGVIAAGDEFRVANGNAAITAGPGGVKTAITDNSFLWNVQMADGTAAAAPTNNTELYFFVAQANTISSGGTTPNTSGAGTVLETLTGSGDAGIQSVLGSFNATSSQDELNTAIDATLPTVDNSALVGGLTISKNSFAIAGNELATLRNSGVSSGATAEGMRYWGEAFGQTIDQGSRDNIAGYDADTVGFAVGADTENLRKDLNIGVALSYANTSVDSDNSTNTKSDINSYQVTLYGDYDLDKSTYVASMLGYVYGDNDSTRYNVGGAAGLNANADFASNQFIFETEVGKSYKTSNQLANARITPNALVHYTYYKADDYTETGAGGASLTVENDAMNILELGVGVDVDWELPQDDGAILKPAVNAGYRYDLIGDEVESSARFTAGGAAFNTMGVDPAQGTLNLGASLSYEMPENVELTASYDFESKSDYTSHAAILRASYKF